MNILLDKIGRNEFSVFLYVVVVWTNVEQWMNQRNEMKMRNVDLIEKINEVANSD